MSKEIYELKDGQCYKVLFRKWSTHWRNGKKFFVKLAKALKISIKVDNSFCNC